MAGWLNSSEDRGPMAEINITPLVDVMLVLLVIFMVTAPLMESGIAIQLPKASAKALPKDEVPLTLNITKEAKLFLGREEVSQGDLIRRLHALMAKRDSKEVFIRADHALPYGSVAQIMALIKAAGIHKIGLVTLPPDSKSH